VKRGGSLSFLVGTIRNVLVMEIGWTDVGSGGYILVSNTSSFYILDSNSDGVRSGSVFNTRQNFLILKILLLS
jgi:hypothetical protein